MLRSACYAYYALAAQVYIFSPAFPDPDMRGEKKAVACALTTRQSKTSAPECPEWLERPWALCCSGLRPLAATGSYTDTTEAHLVLSSAVTAVIGLS